MTVNFTWLWPNTEITELSGEQVYLGSRFQRYHHTWHIQFSLLPLGQWERCDIIVGPCVSQLLITWQLGWEKEREEGTAASISPARGLLQRPDFLPQGSTFSVLLSPRNATVCQRNLWGHSGGKSQQPHASEALLDSHRISIWRLFLWNWREKTRYNSGGGFFELRRNI